jgi:hypothetical protein
MALPVGLSAGLVGRGLTFVQACWEGFDGWSPVALVLLRETGLLLDRLEQVRDTPAEGATRRALLATLTRLKLD